MYINYLIIAAFKIRYSISFHFLFLHQDNGRCFWTDLKITNNNEVTLTHRLEFEFTSTSLIRQNDLTFDSVNKEVIIESRIHARKSSMAMDYKGPVENVQPAIDLFNLVAVDGRDDITVNPVNTGNPVDLTFNQRKIKYIENNCQKFPCSVKNYFC